MGFQELNGKTFSAATWALAAKPCDSCKSAAALLFCRADSAFLCVGCDSKIHGANKLASRHERVWMCEVCEQAPASVTCKADAAALCVTCDRDIHSANPLARRHDRVPVVPFYDSAESLVKSTAAAVGFLVPGGAGDEEDSEAASWLLPNPKLPEGPEVKSGEVFFSDIDPFLDFDYPDAKFPHHHHHHCGGNDGVVPVQAKDPSPPVTNHPADNCFELDFSRSKLSAYNYTAQSLSQSISSSDVGVVPDGNCNSMSDTSYPSMKQVSGGGGGGSTGSQATQLSGMDREARVLRYREKRKNRKFEKTIRYASRKAYAETRPRIKGRFAKRTEMESEMVDHIYNSASAAAFMVDAGYGVVPSY
ncbi:hypothetical protein VitviT2T_017386 [Vitis vinifera]|uniref:CONSTANS-like protein 5 n=3 Tax=Vitis TaxID=3603 RepID=F6GXA6_VITVI|nr:zinc finger protein CONSTANS-LIKE 5 [Vitis vinifera]ATD87378.1 CONSTANS-like protein 5 [Vitis vinifera]WAP79229.1 zinc finger protein constans-like 5 [Vitis amurensis]WJZ98895.1 hypothetical protein VitviT2T_017386 [Vitis vinifera]|eukprot:XP_002277953.1 PREDICTED: zinc finger protein CONSTANS-LIKE 5 [Vitis vinifera]